VVDLVVHNHILRALSDLLRCRLGCWAPSSFASSAPQSAASCGGCGLLSACVVRGRSRSVGRCTSPSGS
jgi:hypothetical protein